MVHGIAGYFRERARFERRASLLALAVSLTGLGALFLVRSPVVRRALPESARFGFEGPEQFVRRITLDQVRGRTSTLADVGQLQASSASSRRGGRSPSPSRAKVGQPAPQHRYQGPGSTDSDLAQRSVSRLAGVPVFQSEELIIDRLVRPQYPPELLERNIEGKVMLQALVDTVGRVIEVQVLASTGEAQFELAAQDAVMQCRFRPFRPEGAASEIYAVFRFSFKIY
jgi:TonB family protein